MRFVVVEIPDNDDADAFVKAVENGAVWYAVFAVSINGEVKVQESAYKDWKVPQVYQVPTKFCDCPSYTGKDAKSSKYGWWVHAACGKPRPGALQHPYNLVERAQGVHSTKSVYYMGFRADRKPWIILPDKKP
jgi:hypothetical protein